MTLYKGVSLGKLFTRDISFVYIGYARINSALSKIYDEFRPTKIYFYDFKPEFCLLDRVSKREIVESVSESCGAGLVDCLDWRENEDKSNLKAHL